MTMNAAPILETAGELEFVLPHDGRGDPRGGMHPTLRANKSRVAWVLYAPDHRVYRVRILLTPEEEGGFSVHAPSLPGAVSQGDTEEEALAMIQDAAREILRAYDDLGEQARWNRDPVATEQGQIERWVVIDVDG